MDYVWIIAMYSVFFLSFLYTKNSITSLGRKRKPGKFLSIPAECFRLFFPPRNITSKDNNRESDLTVMDNINKGNSLFKVILEKVAWYLIFLLAEDWKCTSGFNHKRTESTKFLSVFQGKKT